MPETDSPQVTITEPELRSAIQDYFDEGDTVHEWPAEMPLQERAGMVADWLLERVRLQRSA